MRRGLLLVMLVVLPLPSARADPSKPRPSVRPTTPQPRAWLAKRVGKRLRPDCWLANQPCEWVADFDGDGAHDVAITVKDTRCAQAKPVRDQRACRQGLALLLASGKNHVLGAGVAAQWTSRELGEADASRTAVPLDLEELVRIELVPQQHGAVRWSRRAAPVSPPGLMGDALLIDGGDAAALLYLAVEGPVLVHLGF